MNNEVLIITGSGVSVESGIPTFRGKTESLYDDKQIMSLISKKGIAYQREELYTWLNKFKKSYSDAKPNEFHEFLTEIESSVIFTQNVDELHEQAGSTNVFHLHGNINELSFIHDNEILVGRHNDIFIPGMVHENSNGDEVRPKVVLFNEMPFFIEEFMKAITEAKIIIIAGCSLEITYINSLLNQLHNEEQIVITINPSPERELTEEIFNRLGKIDFYYIEKPCTESIPELKKILDGYKS